MMTAEQVGLIMLVLVPVILVVVVVGYVYFMRWSRKDRPKSQSPGLED